LGVVVDDGAVAIGAAVAVWAVIRGREFVAVQADQDEGLLRNAGRAEQHTLFIHTRRIPRAVPAGTRGEHPQPAGQQPAGGHSHAQGRMLHLGNLAGADHVFDAADYVGDIHAGDAAARARRAHGPGVVAVGFTTRGGAAGGRRALRARPR